LALLLLSFGLITYGSLVGEREAAKSGQAPEEVRLVVKDGGKGIGFEQGDGGHSGFLTPEPDKK
jgi:hypothetical protein